MDTIERYQPLTCAWCRLRVYPQFAIFRYHEDVKIPLHERCEVEYLRKGKYEGFKTGRTREEFKQAYKREYKVIR